MDYSLRDRYKWIAKFFILIKDNLTWYLHFVFAIVLFVKQCIVIMQLENFSKNNGLLLHFGCNLPILLCYHHLIKFNSL